MCAWQKHKKKVGGKSRCTALVAIRRQQVAFNAQFVAQAELNQHTSVSVSLTRASSRLGSDSTPMIRTRMRTLYAVTEAVGGDRGFSNRSR
jgi:hypothetical protein